MENILTVEDVARKFQMSKSAIYKMAENGKIPSFKIGTCRRFSEDKIASFLLSCEETVTTTPPETK
jgi:excisionase family DNA binding protein